MILRWSVSIFPSQKYEMLSNFYNQSLGGKVGKYQLIYRNIGFRENGLGDKMKENYILSRRYGGNCFCQFYYHSLNTYRSSPWVPAPNRKNLNKRPFKYPYSFRTDSEYLINIVIEQNSTEEIAYKESSVWGISSGSHNPTCLWNSF